MSIYTLSYERDRRREQNAVLDQWDDEIRPALTRLRDRVQAVLDEVEAIMECRSLGYSAETATALRMFAADLAGGALDLLSDQAARARLAADDAGLRPELLEPLDLSELTTDHERWSADVARDMRGRS